MGETLLAFDVGARRIGVAVGNDLLRRADPVAIVEIKDGDDGWRAIERLVGEWRPDRMVVGLPFAVDGTKASPAFARCARFAVALAERFGKPVDRVDERYSSIDATALHRERRRAGLAKRAAATDDLAAQVILQRWFDALPA